MDLWSDIIAMEYPSPHILSLVITSKGCVEMGIPWLFCRIIGPLLSQRFLLASAKAQPRGGFKYVLVAKYYVLILHTHKSDSDILTMYSILF